MIGQTLAHYRILDRLGDGGMGEVFLAENTRLQRQVALKILRPPDIAAVYEVAEKPVAFLAMEYVEGRTFSAHLAAAAANDGPWPGAGRIDRVLALVQQIVSALQAAHDRGIVHRDLKPSNLMVSERGLLKVLDFGVASRRAGVGGPDDVTWTVTHPSDTVAGTPWYMAPEQARGLPTDARADVFSLGVLLYEAISGHRPFEGRTLVEVLDAVLHREPAPLADRLSPPLASDPRVPSLERLLARMLAKDPARRCGSMREIAHELAALTVTATPGGAAASLSRGADDTAVREQATTSGDALTVAVVGFRNLTGGGEDDWLAAALNETVTTALTAVDGLEVFGRDRVAVALRQIAAEVGTATTTDARDIALEERAVRIGRRVGARWVVEGAFQRLDDSVRATAQIVETASGRLLRAVQVDGTMDQVFRLQDRLVADLVTGLRSSVASVEDAAGQTAVVAALEALQRGVLNARADTHECWERAILFFERATALDPYWARAHLELGVAYSQKAESLVAPEFHDRALLSLRRARDLRPRWARSWREVGLTLVYLSRDREGIEHLQHALKLAPEDPAVLAGLGRAHFLGRADFAAAADYLARAVARQPQAGWYWLQLAHCRTLLRDLDGGEEAARRAVDLQQGFLSGQQGILIVGAHMRGAHLAALRGDWQRSLDSLQCEVAFLQSVDHALRSRIQVELNLRFGADDPYTRFYAAAIHALRGEVDAALYSLGRAFAARPAFTRARALIEPEFDALRAEPAFRALFPTP